VHRFLHQESQLQSPISPLLKSTHGHADIVKLETNMVGHARFHSSILVSIQRTHGTLMQAILQGMLGVETGKGVSLTLRVLLIYSNSDELHAIGAPDSSRCDLCMVSFCGIGIPRRCRALPLITQVPDGLTEVVQLLSCEEIVDIFSGNLVERDYFIDHLQALDITPITIYRDVCTSMFFAQT
jgi:hypothetical protein